MPQTCLITGGAGFIGCTLTHVLADSFNTIIVMDNLHPQIHPKAERPHNLNGKAELYTGDVTSARDWDDLLRKEKPEVVLHLAAETGTGQSLMESYRHTNVNVVGTAQMLDAFVRNDAMPKRILLTSSRAVYGEGLWKSLNTGELYYPGQRTAEQLADKKWDFEDSVYQPLYAGVTNPAPTSIYGATKLAQENIIKAWATAFRIRYAIVRLQNVYGPGQSLINPYTGIVSLFVRLAKEHKSIPLYEDGLMLRDFIFIDDIVKAIARAIEVMPQEILDIGTGYSNTIADMADIIAERYSAPKPHICEKFRYGDVRHALCDNNNTKVVLDWTPEYSLKQGIEILCGWIDEQIGR